MNALPDEMVVHVCRFLKTSDAAAWGTTSRAYWSVIKRCAWLWRTARVIGMECTSWSYKRTRDGLCAPLMPQLLQTHGAHLTRLFLGSHCLLPGFVLTNAHLKLIGECAPNLEYLRLGYARSLVSPDGLHALGAACPKLLGLDMSTMLCVDMPLSRVPTPWSHLGELQLHGEGLSVSRMLHSALPLHRIAVLRLINIIMLNSLSVLAHCVSLSSLWIQNCTSMTTHPEHLHESLGYAQVLAQLRDLHVWDSGTVVCMSTLLGDIQWGRSTRWSLLEELGVSLCDAEHALESNDIKLSCDSSCATVRMPLGLSVTRCDKCRDVARPKLRRVWYRTGINF